MVILFGPAGSGKSLQGQTLAKKYGWRWLSVGQLLRDQNDPELEKIMLKGDLVDDSYVVKMMHGATEEAKNEVGNAFLDGYPRNEWQARWIVENGDSKDIDGAIIINVSDDELWRRLEDRGRADDTRESIEQRWAIFRSTIEGMREILEKDNVRFEEIDGEGTVEAVTERIEEVLKKWELISPEEK